MGEFVAFDPIKGKRAWTIKEPLPVFGGALATAGNVVFYGTLDKQFKAVDANTGKLLLSKQLECGVASAPITFKGPDGKQRVAITTGLGFINGGFAGGPCPRRDHLRRGEEGSPRCRRRRRRLNSAPPSRLRRLSPRRPPAAMSMSSSCPKPGRPRAGEPRARAEPILVDRSLFAWPVQNASCPGWRPRRSPPPSPPPRRRRRIPPSQIRLCVVCADPANLPYSNEAREGFENKIAALLADDLHAELKYFWFAEHKTFLRRTLLDGRCDAVISVPAGLPGIAATKPYFASSYVVVTRAADERRFTSFDDPLAARCADRASARRQ